MALRAKELGNIRKLTGVMKGRIIRLIALEVRPRRIAYAVFETPTRLLDWGVRGAGRGLKTASGFAGVLKTYRPSVLVLRSITSGGRRDHPRTQELLTAIEAEAKQSAITVAFVTARELEVFFRQHGRATKHQIAEAIGEWFPQLASRVPPQRKAWQPEHWRMPLFDAMATAMAYLAEEQVSPDGS
jgi:hypothetical protein